MKKPYSKDLREAAVRAYREGKGTQFEIAATFGIHYKTLQNWLKMDAAGLAQVPRGKGHRSRVLTAEHRQRINDILKENNSVTIREIKKLIGIECATSVYYRAIRELGYTNKKKNHSYGTRTT